jgi:hypothetical protein
LIVSRIKNHSFLQDMFKDVQYTFLSIHWNNEFIIQMKKK